MELRYLGFDQLDNARAYRFDVIAKGEATRQLSVTVDLGLFRTHHWVYRKARASALINCLRTSRSASKARTN